MQLSKEGFEKRRKLLGTNAASIDKAEDREQFKHNAGNRSAHIPQALRPQWRKLRILPEIGYPVIVRPAFTSAAPAASLTMRKSLMLKTDSPSPLLRFLSVHSGWKESSSGHARQSGQHHRRLQHGECGPRWRSYGRQHCRSSRGDTANKEYQASDAALDIITARH